MSEFGTDGEIAPQEPVDDEAIKKLAEEFLTINNDVLSWRDKTLRLILEHKGYDPTLIDLDAAKGEENEVTLKYMQYSNIALDTENKAIAHHLGWNPEKDRYVIVDPDFVFVENELTADNGNVQTGKDKKLYLIQDSQITTAKDTTDSDAHLPLIPAQRSDNFRKLSLDEANSFMLRHRQVKEAIRNSYQIPPETA